MVGAKVGSIVGARVGASVGAIVGARVGSRVGASVGARVGANVGAADVGLAVGLGVGDVVGLAVGLGVGDVVGLAVGFCVGEFPTNRPGISTSANINGEEGVLLVNVNLYSQYATLFGKVTSTKDREESPLLNVDEIARFVGLRGVPSVPQSKSPFAMSFHEPPEISRPSIL